MPENKKNLNRAQQQKERIHSEIRARAKAVPVLPISIVATILAVIGAILLLVGCFVLKDDVKAELVTVPNTAIEQPEVDEPNEDDLYAESNEENLAEEGDEENPGDEDINSEATPNSESKGESLDEENASGVPQAQQTSSEDGETIEDAQSGEVTREDTDLEEIDNYPAESELELKQEPAPQIDINDFKANGVIVTNKIKLVLEILGLVFIVVSAILHALAISVQAKSIKRLLKMCTDAFDKANEMLEAKREPTTEEKLNYAFSHIPTLSQKTSSKVQSVSAGNYDYSDRTPMNQQQGVPANRVDSAPRNKGTSQANSVNNVNARLQSRYNQMLREGNREATEKMIASKEYVGISIDIENCLNLYNSGVDAPYRITKVEKDYNAPFMFVNASSSEGLLFPNPYYIASYGIDGARGMQKKYYIMKAFDIVYHGRKIDEAGLSQIVNARIKQVAGAVIGRDLSVTTKGQIEME